MILTTCHSLEVLGESEIAEDDHFVDRVVDFQLQTVVVEIAEEFYMLELWTCWCFGLHVDIVAAEAE